ncbi:hypothetical protein VTN49DRAFT_2604 [Thermomyces lanuginosus]|uniref:uncharacterized protein n=1 Tax=Thermomyces lanuginosus TaxID=5541 RepID=UPI003743F898
MLHRVLSVLPFLPLPSASNGDQGHMPTTLEEPRATAYETRRRDWTDTYNNHNKRSTTRPHLNRHGRLPSVTLQIRRNEEEKKRKKRHRENGKIAGKSDLKT